MESESNIGEKEKLFDALGGYETLKRVHKIFYDKVYEHAWLKQFFEGHSQQLIEDQQTDFMALKMGGPKDYCGKEPRYAHLQMYITDEIFEVRHELLRESLVEAGVHPELIERWLRIDAAFRRQVVKPSLEAFHAEYTFKKRIIVPKPEGVASE